MKLSSNIGLVKTLRAINSLSGFLTLFSLIVMLIAIYMQKRSAPYYISGGMFLVFGLIFCVTAVMFMVRSIVWHIQAKRMRYLFRHYLYALLIACVALMILSHITVGKIGWMNNLLYSPLLSLGSIYLSGYLLAPTKAAPAEASDLS